VEGRGYADTGYLYNPQYASLGPRTYPPVFPALLAPVYATAGLDLRAMKLEIILLFAGSLLLIYAAFRDSLPGPALLVVVAAVGLHPWFWELKDQVVSDIPHMLFTYLALLLVARWYAPGSLDARGMLRAGVTGLAMYLAYGTRTIGIVLVLALIVYDVLRSRRLSFFSVVVVAVFATLAIIQASLLPGEGGYLGQLRDASAQRILSGTRSYLSLASTMWDNGFAALPRKLLFIVGMGLAAAGFVRRVRAGVTVGEVFVAGYLATILLWPSVQGARFLIPILPLVFLYTFLGLDRLVHALGPAWRRAAWGVSLIAVVATYAGRYAAFDYGPMREGIARPESVALFEYVKARAPADAVFVFVKPRALALMTGRQATANHAAASDAALWTFLRRVRAGYLVVGPETLEPAERAYLLGFIRRHGDRFTVTYANPAFTVFSVGTGKT
jgi:hypothetical protein